MSLYLSFRWMIAAFDGRLFTYHKNDHGFKDTGLRFAKANEDTFSCPVCKAKLKAVYL